MNKQTLRSLGLGFLLSAILAGTFAIFGQGNMPIPGITVNSLFKTNTDNDAELAQYRDEVSQLQEEKSTLESEKAKLNESVSALTKQLNESTSSESSTARSNEASNRSTNEESSSNENSSSSDEPAITETFSIQDGEVSSDIAQRLQQEGFIENATELQELISYWGLDSMIVAGDYQLTSDMSIHQIAELITNGAYYYIPQ